MTTDTQDFSHLRALAEAATPGEWKSKHHGVFVGEHRIARVEATLGKYEPEEDNRNYIAAAQPATVIALLDKLEALQAELLRFKEDAKRIRKYYSDHCNVVAAERDQALARLAELEKQEPVAWRYYVKAKGEGGYWQLNISRSNVTGEMPLFAASGASPVEPFQPENDNPHNVDRPNEKTDYGHDNSVSSGYQTPYYCAKCGGHMGDTDSPKNVPERKYAVCYECQQAQPSQSVKVERVVIPFQSSLPYERNTPWGQGVTQSRTPGYRAGEQTGEKP